MLGDVWQRFFEGDTCESYAKGHRLLSTEQIVQWNP